MFTSIHIKSFRSCRDVRLQGLDSMLVLIGRNGAGKTNVMKAIAWACDFASNQASDSKTSAAKFASGDVQLSFTIGEVDYCYSVRRTTSFDNEIKLKVDVEEKFYIGGEAESHLILHRVGEDLTMIPLGGENTKIRISSGISCLPAIHSLLPDNEPFKEVSEKLLNFLGAVKYYPLHNFEEVEGTAFIPSETYKKWKSDKQDAFNSVKALQCTLIEISEEQPEVLLELNHLIGPNGLGIIDEISVEAHSIPGHSSEERKAAFYYITVSLHSDPRSIYSVNDLSFGTLRILFAVVAMLYDKASVALLEQPEDGIHMALIKKLIPMLREYSYRSQFIISSHSSAVMNLTQPSEIRFITNELGFTTARPMSDLEFEVAKEFLEEEGTFAEFLQSLGA